MYEALPNNVIHIAGEERRMNGKVGSDVAVGALLPGMALEIYSDGGTWAFRPNATADTPSPSCFIAPEKSLFNKSLTDPYVAGEELIATVEQAGNQFYALCGVGVNLAVGDKVQLAADGTFKKLATGVGRWQALASTGGALAAQTLVLVTQLW